MYLRTTSRKNKDGSVVRYLQLAHNVWDPVAKRSKVQVVHNFGREDQTNRAALDRLVASVSRFLGPERVLAAATQELSFIESRPLGGVWALEGLWQRLGIGRQLTACGPSARQAGGAGAVCAGGQPGAGAVVQAGRRGLGVPGRAY